MKKFTKKIIVFVLAAVVVISGIYTVQNASAARKIKLNKTKLTLKEGKKYTLKLVNAKKKVTWSSFDSSIAKVNKSGVVTAVKKGKTSIIARYNKAMYTCEVNVKKAPAPAATKTPVTPNPTDSPDKTPVPTTEPTSTPAKKPVDVPDNTLGSGEHMVKIGMTQSEVISSLGNPSRKDVSPFGFESYIYKNSDGSDYLLVDIKNDKVVNTCGVSDRIAYGKEVTGETTASELSADSSWRAYSWYNAADNSGKSLGSGAFTKKTGNVILLAFVDYFSEGKNVYCIQAFDSSYSLDDMTKPSIRNCSYSNQTINDISSEIFDMTNAYRAANGLSSLKWLEGLEKSAASYSKSLADSGLDNAVGRAGEELFNSIYSNNLDPLCIGENAYYGCPDAVGFTNSLILQEGSRENILGIVETYNGKEQDKYACMGIACSYKKSANQYKLYVIQDFCSGDF